MDPGSAACSCDIEDLLQTLGRAALQTKVFKLSPLAGSAQQPGNSFDPMGLPISQSCPTDFSHPPIQTACKQGQISHACYHVASEYDERSAKNLKRCKTGPSPPHNGFLALPTPVFQAMEPSLLFIFMENDMRKLLMVALAGFLWKKFNTSKPASPTPANASTPKQPNA